MGTDTKLTSSKTWTVNTLGGLTMNFSKVLRFMIADVGFFPPPTEPAAACLAFLVPFIVLNSAIFLPLTFFCLLLLLFFFGGVGECLFSYNFPLCQVSYNVSVASICYLNHRLALLLLFLYKGLLI